MSYTPIYDHLKKTFTYPKFEPKTLPPDPYSPDELNKYHEEQAAFEEENYQKQQAAKNSKGRKKNGK